MKSIALLVLVSGVLLAGCAYKNNSFDATGTFEADEVVVSAELSGRILSLQAAEGDLLQKAALWAGLMLIICNCRRNR